MGWKQAMAKEENTENSVKNIGCCILKMGNIEHFQTLEA